MKILPAPTPTQTTLADVKPGEKATIWIPYSDVNAVVVVLAIAKGYAMVRRPGCVPFVCTAKTPTLDLDPKGSAK